MIVLGTLVAIGYGLLEFLFQDCIGHGPLL